MKNLTTLEMVNELISNPNNKYECDFGIVEMSNGDIIWHHSKMIFSLAYVNLSAKWCKLSSID